MQVTKRKKLTKEELLDVIELVAFEIRDKYYSNIEEFYANGESKYDCYQINEKLAKRIRSRLRKLGKRRVGRTVNVELVSVAPLLDYQAKHYAVLVEFDGERYIVDAVPELTGLIPSYDALEPDSPLVVTEEEYREFFKKYLY